MPEEEVAISEADAELLRDIEALLVAEEKDKIGTLYAGTAAEGHEGGPYPWQVRFHTVGADSHLRCIMAGNRCVAPDQRIDTTLGTIRADEVRPGHQLASFNFRNQSVGYGTVTACIIKPKEPIYRVQLSNSNWLKAAGNHRVFAGDPRLGEGGEWVFVQDLCRGSKLLSARGGSPIEVVGISCLSPQYLYDFTVEPYHNYIAAGVVNHNSGKTRTGSAEVAIHLTGRYPDWWTGRRFDRPIECWVGSETNEASRDIVQKALLGPPDSPGTGMIPAEAFDPKDIQWRQAGIPDVADMVKVRHASGGISYCQFKTYEQGRKRWQGTAKDLIWLDEEPPVDIFTEAITRTLDKNGTTILTFTPLMGMGEVVLKVLSGGDGIYLVNASWDDCPHLDEQAKARLLETYPEHERATRKSGQPMLGVGAVYPVQDDEISCDPFAIPNYFRRICGIDFGINHPAAAAWIAHDADTDVIYVYDCYRKANESAPYHAAAIRRRGPWIPVAWPHDGMNRDKGSGIELAEQYRSAGVDILPFSARYDDEKGGGQPTEPVVNDILERMRTGRFKVFRSLNEWFEEKRMYHRNDRGVIVRERDDLMAATNYAVMMVRHAMSESNHLSMKRFAGQTMEPYDALSNFLRR